MGGAILNPGPQYSGHGSTRIYLSYHPPWARQHEVASHQPHPMIWAVVSFAPYSWRYEHEHEQYCHGLKHMHRHEVECEGAARGGRDS